MKVPLKQLLPFVCLFGACISAFTQKRTAFSSASTLSKPIEVAVDATQVTEKILHSRLRIPVNPGPVTLVYPKWIPGEHSPTGPIADLTGIEFSVNGQRISWRRDLVDMYAFHVAAPPGVTSLEARLDLVMPGGQGIFSAAESATLQLDLLSWNQLVLYPQGASSDDVNVTASVKLPAGWHYGTALPVETESGGQVNFKTVSLTTLVDSPVLAGAHFRRIPLTPDGPIPHYIDEAADGDAALDMPPETIAAYKRLVAETGALWGARHYREYHFLLTLSDHTAHFGLEHHESSDDRVAERTMIDDDRRLLASGLLPHEMTHSWNGKYRRPAGLATANYQEPMKGDLLWVYEGMTTYWGEVLPPRSGLVTPQQFMEGTALTAAALDHTPGRTWRALQDTADAAQLLYGSSFRFESWRRSVDYYPEGFLIWLEADTLIRQQTRGAKSLNDFCRLFGGPPDSAPRVIPYTFEDVVKMLNQVTPYNWAKFLRDRLDTNGPGAPLGGITNGGWKLVYDDKPNDFSKAEAGVAHLTDERFSIGLIVNNRDGRIADVIINSPAWNAGITPGMTLVAVNGRKFDPDVLSDALKLGKTTSSNLELMTLDGEFYRNHTLNYHDGEKFPHLVRDESKPDILSEIIKPLSK